MVQYVADFNLKKLRKEFEKIDTTQDGFLSKKEIIHGIKRSGMNLCDESIEEIAKSLDYDEDQRINYDHFLAATVPLSKLLSNENLSDAFSWIDHN